MIKAFGLRRLAGLAALVFVLTVFVGFSLRNILLMQSLQSVIGAPVTVKSFDVNFSRVRLGDLTIKSPKGFGEPDIAKLPEIYVAYDLGAIFRGKIRIPEIRVDVDHVTVERNGAGQINLTQLGAMKKKEAAKQAPSKPAAKSGKGLHTQIDRVDISIGRGRFVDTMQNPVMTKEFEIGTKHLILKDVHEPAYVVEQIVLITLQKIGMAFVKGQIVSGLEATAKNTLENMKRSFQSIFPVASSK